MDLRSPTAIEAERALLGALLQDADAAVDALAIVAPRDCYRPEHEALLALIIEMVDAGDAVDIVTVSERVQQRGASRYGGLAYVVELPEHAPSTTNAAHYASSVALAARRRRTMRAAATLAEAAADGNVPLDEALAAFFAGLDDLAPASKERDGLIGEKIRLTNAERVVEPRVFPTGLPSLDQIIGGLSAGELTVVAGRPAWGKTSLCIGMLLEHALSGRPCGMVSLEMSRAQIVHRYVAQLAGVPIRYVASGGLDAGDEAAIADAHRQLADVPLHIEQPGGQTLADIARLIRRWKRDTGLDIVAIDYLGLIKRAPSKAPTHEQVGAAVKDLKRLALELDVAVVLAVQLNRAMVADRPRKTKGGDWWTKIPTPQLHHLAESGDVERDADKVLLPIPADVIRDGGLCRDLDAPRGAAVVIVAKNRQGPLGVAACRWYGATASYHPEPPALQAVSGGHDRHYSDTEREEEP